MHCKLTDDQSTVVDAAREALSRADTLAAARSALDGGSAPSAWNTASAAGWAGLLLPEDVGGAGATVADALLVTRECGRVLAAAHLPAHLSATHLLAAANVDAQAAARLAVGELRAVYVGSTAGLTTISDGDHLVVRGTLGDVIGAVGADIAVLATPNQPVLVRIDGAVTVTTSNAFDPTRALGSITFDDAPARAMTATVVDVEGATLLQQALLGAESLGAAERCLDIARGYAINRVAFGRPIGSYQAVKHTVVEMLRRVENAASLLYYAGWCWTNRPDDFEITAYSLRTLADDALSFAATQAVFIHGAIGTTWEHDLSLYYRRAQHTRRLAGGAQGAARAVASALIRQATARSAPDQVHEEGVML